MNDKEVALKLTELTGRGYDNEKYSKVYLNILEEIRNSKSKTIIGKLKELFNEYDHKSYRSEMDNIRFIEDVGKILLESEEE